MKTLDQVKKVVVSLSGGLDSTTLLYLAVNKLGKDNVYVLSFDYNQRHDVELQLARQTCQKLGVAHKVVNLGFLGEITANVSAMVKGSVATPTIGDLSAEKQVPTYVPFRNTILSALTFAYAESVGADAIALGVQYGDYENNEVYRYWDCSKAFTEAMQNVANLNDKHHVEFVAPFVSLTKKDEIELGVKLGVDYSLTWTCYSNNITTSEVRYEEEPSGGKNPVTYDFWKPCQTCPSCVGRAEAFKALGLEDPQKGTWKRR